MEEELGDMDDLIMNESDIAYETQTTDNIFFHRGFEKIRVLNDIPDVKPYFQICQHLLREIGPTTVVTSKTLSVDFLESIQTIVNELNNEENTPEKKMKFITVASKHFQYSQCKVTVSKMRFAGQKQDLLDDQRWNYLQTTVNFDYKMMICALGALLHFLDTHVSKIVLHIPSLHIIALHTLSLDHLVWIDTDSYKALEIFAPASIRQASPVNTWSREGSKESLCLHSIFNRCHSALGSSYMKILLYHPTKDIDSLSKRHEVIEFFLSPDNQVILKNIQDCLKKIKNIATIIVRIVGTQATPSQWKSFYKTIHNAIAIAEFCRANNTKAQLFQELSDSLDDSLFIITQLIERFFDFEESENSGRFVIKEGADSDLDEIKKSFKDLPKLMESVAYDELETLPSYIESCSLVYFPEIGYLLAVSPWKNNLSKEDVILPGMEFKFFLNNVVHYKTARCTAMDETVGDSHLIVLRHEIEIMVQITSYIGEHIGDIITVIEKIKLLDCLIAFSSVAREYGMVKPTLVNDQVLDISNGCHLLTQRCVKSFIANDYKSSMSDSMIKIFTGPNSSGKSVYLKQVALIVYMAHIGSFVPAEKAVIGVVDYIHTRIKATESVSTELSSFTLDLRQMCSSLYNFTPNTLVVIDEFGKGTADVDGISLLYGFIKNFLDHQENCPHVLLSTHFQSIVTLLPNTESIKLQTFDFIVENGIITQLYKLKDGFVNSSFAHLVAASAGVQKRIIDRADEIMKIMISEDEEPAPNPENPRTKLMLMRKNCIGELIAMMKLHKEGKVEVQLQDVVKLLNNVRF